MLTFTVKVRRVESMKLEKENEEFSENSVLVDFLDFLTVLLLIWWFSPICSCEFFKFKLSKERTSRNAFLINLIKNKRQQNA